MTSQLLTASAVPFNDIENHSKTICALDKVQKDLTTYHRKGLLIGDASDLLSAGARFEPYRLFRQKFFDFALENGGIIS
jgi:hypothetical protein